MRAVIEVKIADKRWSAKDFLRAPDAQLVGQYLRHERCRAGFLLLTYNGDKPYWQHPETKKRLYFGDLIEFLNESAKKIERREQGSVRIAVVGLNLQNPDLPKAHA